MDVLANVSSLAEPVETDKDVIELVKSGATPIIQSRNTVKNLVKPPGVREFKRRTQQNLGSGAPSRLNNSHSFRTNGLADNYATSLTATSQVNAYAHGPRTTSGPLAKAPPTIHHSLGNSDEMEPSQYGSPNRKRPSSIPSPPPPVAKFCVRRPSKRRSNLTPVSGHNEISASDFDTTSMNDGGLRLTRRLSSNFSKEVKFRSDHLPLVQLSESEESGAAVKILENKIKNRRELEEIAGVDVRKVTTAALPPIKYKPRLPALNEKPECRELEEVAAMDVHKVTTAALPPIKYKPRLPALNEKPEYDQWRSGNISPEKVHRKRGRPPKKKCERKGNSRERHPLNNTTVESAGEQDDDHYELLAAACAALDSKDVCFSSFWKQIEPYFGFLSAEDAVFVNQQGDIGASTEEFDRDKGFSTQTRETDLLLEKLERGNGVPNGATLFHSLVSAIITEKDIDFFYYANRNGEELLFDDACGFHVEDFHEDEPHIEGHALDELLPNQTMACPTVFNETHYSQMYVDDRILIELFGVGIYPERMPDLTQSEEEDIGKCTDILKENLHKQVMEKKKSLLPKDENAVIEAKEHQLREFERLALVKNVGSAYKRYMACCVPNAYGSEAESTTAKHATLASMRRTLGRYRKFEETGISCFNEPPFRDTFLSLYSQNECQALGICAHGEDGYQSAPNLPTGLFSTDKNTSLASKPPRRVNIEEKHSDTLPLLNNLSEQDDSLIPSIFQSSLVCYRKGKRRKIDRKVKNKNPLSVIYADNIGCPYLSHPKGKRNGRRKPEQKKAESSFSLDGLLNTVPLAPQPHQMVADGSTKNDVEAVNLCSLQQIQEMDCKFGGHGEDMFSWLNDVEETMDTSMGLSIPPMDDLSFLMP